MNKIHFTKVKFGNTIDYNGEPHKIKSYSLNGHYCVIDLQDKDGNLKEGIEFEF